MKTLLNVGDVLVDHGDGVLHRYIPEDSVQFKCRCCMEIFSMSKERADRLFEDDGISCTNCDSKSVTTGKTCYDGTICFEDRACSQCY